MSPQDLHTLVVVVHLVALGLGAGGALITDFYIVRHAMMRPIKPGVADTVEFLGTMVSIGLVMLWVSGLILAVELYLSNPTFMTNQKFWAKVIIVAVLTINGITIHNRILPLVRAQIGRRLFDGLSAGRVHFLAFAGAISIVSWMFPLVLGTARQLNYVAPVEVILGFYVLALLAAMCANCSFILLLAWLGRTGRAALALADRSQTPRMATARSAVAASRPSAIEPDRLSLVIGRASRTATARLVAVHAELQAARPRTHSVVPLTMPRQRRTAA